MVGLSLCARWIGRSALATLVLGAIAAAGCGSGVEAEKGLIPVSGQVTLNGGPWPRPGQISFIPTKAGSSTDTASVTSIAPFGVDGSFTVRHEGSNGLKPGTYWIAVDCPEGEPSMPLLGQKVADSNAVPKKYRNPETSGLSFDVAADKPTVASFDVNTK